MTDYRAFQWDISDIGEGYTQEDIQQLQTIIDEELARISEAYCSIQVVRNEDYNGEGIEFNRDERIRLAIRLAYERFIGVEGHGFDNSREIARAEDDIAEWEAENADDLTEYDDA